jgi:hypothetical protein
MVFSMQYCSFLGSKKKKWDKLLNRNLLKPLEPANVIQVMRKKPPAVKRPAASLWISLEERLFF